MSWDRSTTLSIFDGNSYTQTPCFYPLPQFSPTSHISIRGAWSSGTSVSALAPEADAHSFFYVTRKTHTTNTVEKVKTMHAMVDSRLHKHVCHTNPLTFKRICRKWFTCLLTGYIKNPLKESKNSMSISSTIHALVQRQWHMLHNLICP